MRGVRFLRFRHFLVADHQSRDRSALIAMAVGFVVGTLSQKIIRMPFQDAARLAVLAIAGTYLLRVWLYCTSAQRFVRVSRSIPFPTRRLAWSAGSIALLVLLNVVPFTDAEAAVVDRRLRRLTQQVPIDQSKINRIQQTLGHADAYKLPLTKPTIISVQRALKRTAEAVPALSDAAIKAASAAASAATVDVGLPPDMHGPVSETPPEANGSSWKFSVIATNTGPDSYKFFGITGQPNVAIIEEIDAPLPSPKYGPAIVLLKDMTATLDGYHLKHVAFQNMTLIYNGGPVILDNVYFFASKIQVAQNKDGWRLLSAVTKGGWVSFSATQ